MLSSTLFRLSHHADQFGDLSKSLFNKLRGSKASEEVQDDADK